MEVEAGIIPVALVSFGRRSGQEGLFFIERDLLSKLSTEFSYVISMK